ncbi:MAG: DUF427 domain-containing protein [Actinomycetia bacterium]|nr:DUF427 domain-containing protein [Actinomycetes bacterium]MCP5030751.1 DUF427 domain-containing protein [Actinomycetes bacterium]
MTRSTTMVQATFKGCVIAESDNVKVIEGMTYFPVDSVNMDLLSESQTSSRCFWKGKAQYWHVEVGDEVALDAAFTYPKPWPLARPLVTNRIAFWQQVNIERVTNQPGSV